MQKRDMFELIKNIKGLGAVYNRLFKDLKEDPLRTVYTVIFLYLIGFALSLSFAIFYAEINKKEVNIIIQPNDSKSVSE
jgi:hypothetical protein